jgi:tetratricopeptide (TPR) repeat protein
VSVPDPRLRVALGHYQSGRLLEAAAACRAILVGAPRQLGALNLLGAIEASRGEHEVAVEVLRRALAIAPASPRTLSNLGLSLRSLGRLEEALDCFAKALELAPDYAIAWYNRGVVLRDLGRFEAARAAYEKAIALQPAFPDALSNRGDVLQDLGRHDAAVESYDQSIALRPDHAETHSNRGEALRRVGRHEEAIAAYDRALELDSRHARSHAHRGIVLATLGRHDEAIKSYDRAIACGLASPQIHIDRGRSLQETGAFEAALAAYSQAAAIEPGFPDAHWNASFMHLILGNFQAGLEEHEWRWRTPALGLRPRAFDRPLWLGDTPLEGKTILLHSEQGYGDALQMIRYAPALAARGATVLLEVPPGLVRLCASAPGVSTVMPTGERLPQFDLHCPLMSLPLAFGTRLETIPADVPYLRVERRIAAEWEARLGPKRAPRVGLAWAGNPVPPNRSIPLERVVRLFDVPVEFVSLQVEVNPADALTLRTAAGLRHFGSERERADFEDTAALVECMDLVISIDTAVAHLCGAMGKPVWILLQFAPDWRWLLKRADSPWYPTAQLFRQPRPGDWESVLREVRERLLLTHGPGHGILTPP